MTRSSRLLMIGLAVWLAGCASASTSGPGTSSVRVGGLWVGTIPTAGGTAPVEMSLTQRGDQISGTGETRVRGDLLQGLVEARLNGPTMQGSILGSGRTASFTLTLEGAVLKGSIGGTNVELRRQGYLAGSVFRSADVSSMQAP